MTDGCDDRGSETYNGFQDIKLIQFINPPPPPRTRTITEKSNSSSVCRVQTSSCELEKFTRRSVKSMADLAAFMPASKSLMVIEV